MTRPLSRLQSNLFRLSSLPGQHLPNITQVRWDGRDLLITRIVPANGPSLYESIVPSDGGLIEVTAYGEDITTPGRTWIISYEEVVDHGFTMLDVSKNETLTEMIRLVRARIVDQTP